MITRTSKTMNGGKNTGDKKFFFWLKKDQDLTFSIVMILIAGIFLTQVLKLPHSPAMFPGSLLLGMILSSLLIIVKSYNDYKRTGTLYEKISLKDFIFEGGLSGVVLLAFCFLFEILGFYIVSFFMIISMDFVQQYVIEGNLSKDRRTLINSIIFAAGSTVFMYLCFSVFLSLPTPKGFFGF